jgi:ribose 1,5-bisphosphokinase
MTPIGPGRLVLVVGPSGAGKDTLINLARQKLRQDSAVVFARRVVTRPPTPDEDHDTLSDDAFAQAARAGAFALAWEAHGLRYGVPVRIDDDIRAGRTVVCNVSRAIVDEARRRYARVSVALVTAPADVLAQRLAARARGDAIAGRLARADAFDGFRPDCVIANVTAAETGAAELIAVILAKVAARSSAT